MYGQDFMGQLQAFADPVIQDVALWSRRELFLVGAIGLSLILAQKKRWMAAAFCLGAGGVWMALHDSVSDYLQALGSDSFAEAGNFDLKEAFFWLMTLREVLAPNLRLGNFVIPVGIALLGYLGIQILAGRLHSRTAFAHRLPAVISVLAVTIAVFRMSHVALGFYWTNSDAFSSVRKNFDQDVPALVAARDDTKLVVYIGESTSIMNMSLYGYGRDTTPKLRKLREESEGLLVFHNVFSTHSHTSFSLLEALSFGVDARENYWPIDHRRRLSLIDVLERNGVSTALISNQGKTGTWNQAASIIFKSASRTFSFRSDLAANREFVMKRPWDHEFFMQQLQPENQALRLPARLTFLHSYAGHGEYFANIPPAFRYPVDDQYSNIDPNLVFGAAGNQLENLEKYDAAVRYIDDSIHQVIKLIRQAEQPIVFVYFSDHGESVFTGRGHESSRFTHEMARIPFIMYFNDAARQRHKALFDKYKSLSASSRSATLAQVPNTLLELLGARVDSRDAERVMQTAVVGDKTAHPPIMVRKTADGIEFYEIDRVDPKVPENSGQRLAEHKDHASRVYAVARQPSGGMGLACYGHVETLGAALRGTLVSDCLEIDVPEMLGKEAGNSDAAPTSSPATPILPQLLKVAAENEKSVWLRIRSVPGQCRDAVQAIAQAKSGLKSVMLEFPSVASSESAGLKACVESAAQAGFIAAYRIPLEFARPCARALAAGKHFGDAQSCLSLGTTLAALRDGKLFRDIVFEYQDIQAVEAADPGRHFSWSLVGMTAQAYFNAGPRRFRMVALDGVDPNSLPRRGGAASGMNH